MRKIGDMMVETFAAGREKDEKGDEVEDSDESAGEIFAIEDRGDVDNRSADKSSWNSPKEYHSDEEEN